MDVAPQEYFETSIPRDSTARIRNRETGRHKKARGEKMLGERCGCMV